MILKPDTSRWRLVVFLLLASVVFTGCEQGSLGVKAGTAQGFILDVATNRPISEVLVTGDGPTRISSLTGGDGGYTLFDLQPNGNYTISATKFGYTASGTSDVTVKIVNGETVMVKTIYLNKTDTLVRGTLKGYPVDAISGRPVQNFTVVQTSPVSQMRSKLFETAQEFKETGWSSLEGGEHHYKITAENYQDWTTEGGHPVTISKTPHDLGIVRLNPVTVSISGTLRNLNGAMFESSGFDAVFWAEAAGKMVASATTGGTGGANFQGTIVYTLPNVPITAGSVSIKCKIRGYDVYTINPSVSLPKQLPGGTIAGIDANFANVEPIRRDLRVIVNSSKPATDDPGSFPPGEVARIFIKQGGKDVVPYIDVVSQNYFAEGYFSGIPAGFNYEIIVVNQSRGYISKEGNNFKLPEDGNTAFTVTIGL
jgi:hypothetical protein